MKLKKDVKVTEFKLLPHGFLNYDILPIMAEECGKAIFKVAQSMKEMLNQFSNFLEPQIPEIDEEEDMLDNFLEKIGVSKPNPDEHQLSYISMAFNKVLTPMISRMIVSND
jgi:hypothetical protein